jgi:predicted DNA-binding antitoxin AbrB/MazE fold protein
MLETIHAIYEGGVFRPTSPVELPENTEVEFEPRLIDKSNVPSLDDVYKILDKRFETGQPDLAARHNEHRP